MTVEVKSPVTSRKTTNVLILTDSDIGGTGGTERHVRVIAGELSALGHRVHTLQLAPVVPQSKGMVGLSTYDHWPTRRILSIEGVRRLVQMCRLIRSQKIRTIISFFESSDFLAVFAGTIMGVPVLISSRRDTGFRLSNSVVRLYRLINSRFSTIIAASSAVKNSLISTQQVPAEKIRVVYNGLRIADFSHADEQQVRDELRISNDQIVLLCLANFSEWKGHSQLIRAFALARVQRNVILLLAGSGETLDENRDLAEDLGVLESVRFLGTRSDVPKLLGIADIFVMSSSTEGLSNALLEAMAAALPIVATDVGGNPEVVKQRETGILVPYGNPEAFAQAVIELIDNPSMSASFGSAGRKRVQDLFSLNAMLHGYLSALDSA